MKKTVLGKGRAVEMSADCLNNSSQNFLGKDIGKIEVQSQPRQKVLKTPS
jgi:hypothetical protein